MRVLNLALILVIIILTVISCSKKTTEILQCSTPIFSPYGTLYLNQQLVSITSITNGATIYYTIDGSEPSESSLVYNNLIAVDSTMTIKAFATKAGMKKSQTTTATYIIGVPQWEGILVNGGTFTMGKTQGASTAVDAPHQVTISSFYIGKYEVTQGEWSAIFGSNPSNFAGDLGRPVEMVNWYLALVYCNKRSIAESLTPVYSINNTTNPIGWGQIPNISNQNWNNAVCNMNANGYRLPTEAEWEYAARGASNTPDYLYSGSNDINSVAWYVTNSNGSTRRFGLKQANGLGIYDMSGNVWELCWDWYANYNTDPANNPTGPATGQTKVIRGGCWYGLGDYSGVSHRGYKNPSYKDDGIGIRLCRSSM